MLRKLTIAAAAVAFAAASGAASAAEMPAYGTKNFVPGGDTPSYLSHENAAAPVGSADRDINDWAEASPSEPAVLESASSGTSRHGKYASTRGSSKRHGGKPAGRSAHVAKGKPTTSTRTASSRKSSAPHSTAGVTKVKATKPSRATKSTARHAAAQPAATRG